MCLSRAEVPMAPALSSLGKKCERPSTVAENSFSMSKRMEYQDVFILS